MRTYYKMPNNKLFVQLTDERGKPYAFVYDNREVYVDNEGEIRCLKYLLKIRRLWNRSGTKGDCYCEVCEKTSGFIALGFGNFIHME